MSKKESIPSYEDAVRRLQEIVAKLEQGDLALEDSIELFKEGTGLVGICHSKLDNAQGMIEKLMETPDGEIKTQPVQMDSLGV